MKHTILFLAVTFFTVICSTDVSGSHSRETQDINVEDFRSGKLKMHDAAAKHLTKQEARKESKFQKHQMVIQKKKQKVVNLLTKFSERQTRGDSSGIGMALLIIIIGAVLALLGLVGLADLFITIGLVVLAVGLVIWLITSIS